MSNSSNLKPKVLVASCVFPPEPVVSAKTSYDVADYLNNLGYDVTVVCPKPSRNVDLQANQDDFKLGKYGAFRIKRVWSVQSNSSGVISRFIENISYGFTLFMFILFSRKTKLIYANVWPIFAGGLAVLAAKLRRIKIITSVQDLYPESLGSQNRMSEGSFIYRLLLSIDRKIARSTDHIIVISEAFKKVYLESRNVPESKLTIVKNWVKESHIDSIDKKTARENISAHTSLSIEADDTLCVYGGNIGVASGLDEFILYIKEAGKGLKFLIAGDGVLLDKLKLYVDENGLQEQVGFLSPWPLELTSSLLGSADLLILTTAKGQEFASVPSKLITYMLAAKPILLIASKESDSGMELLRAEAGFVVSERSGQALNNVLDKFRAMDVSQRERMGEDGRRYAKENYSFESASMKLDKIVTSIFSSEDF